MTPHAHIAWVGLLPLLIIPFVLAAFIIWLYALIDAARRNFYDPNAKLVWILVIVLTHWIGAIIYLAIGRNQGSL